MFELYSKNYSNTSGGQHQRARRTTSGSIDVKNDNKMSTQSLNSISGGKLSQELAAIRESQRTKQSSPVRQRSTTGVHQIYGLKYVGSSTLDRTYTLPMLPWIIADVKRQSMSSDGYSAINISLEVTESVVKIVNQNDKQILLRHPLNNMSKFTQTANDKSWVSSLEGIVLMEALSREIGHTVPDVHKPFVLRNNFSDQEIRELISCRLNTSSLTEEFPKLIQEIHVLREYFAEHNDAAVVIPSRGPPPSPTTPPEVNEGLSDSDISISDLANVSDGSSNSGQNAPNNTPICRSRGDGQSPEL